MVALDKIQSPKSPSMENGAVDTLNILLNFDNFNCFNSNEHVLAIPPTMIYRKFIICDRNSSEVTCFVYRGQYLDLSENGFEVVHLQIQMDCTPLNMNNNETFSETGVNPGGADPLICKETLKLTMKI
jgi:hypothetical protein